MMDGASARRPQLRVEDPRRGPRGEARETEEVVAKMAAMERRILGPKSEKLPPMDREVRKERPTDPAATQAARRKNAELRATRVVSEDVPHKVPDAERTCPKCSSADLRPVGAGKVSVVLDYVPGYFRWGGRAGRGHKTGHYVTRSDAALVRPRPLLTLWSKRSGWNKRMCS